MILTKSNYFTRPANKAYMSVSQFKAFQTCEAAALAEANGEYQRPATTALLEGSYMDAHFAGTLDEFLAEHPEVLNKRTGALKAEYQRARAAIELVEKDKAFMQYLSGEPQNIRTGQIAGIEWKAKPDFTFPDKIVDLKYMWDMKPIFKDGERKTFIEAWGYHIQGYIYQQLEYQLTGIMKPFYLAVITKEDPADHRIIELPPELLNPVAGLINYYAPRYAAIKRGEVEPVRCGSCAYCRSTKRIKGASSYFDLLDEL